MLPQKRSNDQRGPSAAHWAGSHRFDEPRCTSTAHLVFPLHRKRLELVNSRCILPDLIIICSAVIDRELAAVVHQMRDDYNMPDREIYDGLIRAARGIRDGRLLDDIG